MIALAPSFHPWYAAFPLMLVAATTVRTDLVMAVACAAAFLVLPDGGGLARFVKFPGAPIMTVLIIVLAVQHHRRNKVANGIRRSPRGRVAARQAPDTGTTR